MNFIFDPIVIACNVCLFSNTEELGKLSDMNHILLIGCDWIRIHIRKFVVKCLLIVDQVLDSN